MTRVKADEIPTTERHVAVLLGGALDGVRAAGGCEREGHHRGESDRLVEPAGLVEVVQRG